MSKEPEITLEKLLSVTVAQAATLTGMKREILDAAIRARQLSPMVVPGVTRISRKELDRWLDGLTLPTALPAPTAQGHSFPAPASPDR